MAARTAIAGGERQKNQDREYEIFHRGRN
jgi:hypothetical protein